MTRLGWFCLFILLADVALLIAWALGCTGGFFTAAAWFFGVISVVLTVFLVWLILTMFNGH